MKNILLILLLAPLFSKATTYKVDDTGGSNTNNGISAPWATLSKVASSQGSFNPGDSILFKRGGQYSGSINITVSGSAGNPIVFGAYGSGDKPMFTGNSGAVISGLFYFNNRNYLTFDNLEIKDLTLVGTPLDTLANIRIGWYVDGTSNHNIIQNCKVSYIGDGLSFVGGTNTVTGCDFGYLRLIVNTPGGFDDFGANPVDIQSANNTITYNYFHNTILPSYDFGSDGGAIEFYNPSGGIDNNYIAYNKIELNVGVCEITGSGDNNVFAYNIMINNGATIYFHNNFSATFSGWKYYNNVIIETVASAVGDNLIFGNQGGNFASGQIELKNNIFYLTTGMKVASNGTNIVHTNNTYYNFSGGSTIGYTAGGTELTTSAAIWKNTTGSVYNWDFHPFDNSILSGGANLSLTPDYYGQAVSSPYFMGVSQYEDVVPVNKIRRLWRVVNLP